MFAGTVFQVLQPPVLATANEPTGAFDGLSSTTSTSPLTPPAAPEATLASNWVDPPVPKLTLLYSIHLPLVSCDAWLPSTPDGLASVVDVTVIVPWLLPKQSAEMLEVAVVVHCFPPPPPP